MATFEFPQADVLAECRRDVPENWWVFNAPRPLYGSLCECKDGPKAFTWQGEFQFGIFYAAVDPQDPYARMWLAENFSLRATLLHYITPNDIRAWAHDYFARFPEVDQTSVTFQEMQVAYLNNHPPRTVPLTVKDP